MKNKGCQTFFAIFHHIFRGFFQRGIPFDICSAVGYNGSDDFIVGGAPMRELTIGKNDAGQRLDRFVSKSLPLLPPALLQK